jgi:hypothetical protein
VLIVGFAIKFWYVVVPSLIVWAVWLVATSSRRAERRRLAHEAWLAGPAPPLVLPGRFTQNWIIANVPQLHPGQLHTMFAEMRARGWSEADIERRVSPYVPDHTRE